ncbi:GNAT family N-acetyltransferase [Dinoroseobacter sp. S124A]|uniref:GNAT family N-acetyltransferase n=1 Tax=Dinoroseobacter sp. S124A TaxID=3415128 RepID=UPI003C7B7788
MTVTVRRADPLGPEARALLGASAAMMADRYPAEVNYSMAPEDLDDPAIRFVLAFADDTAIGCAALATRAGYGEIKSMFVAPEARGLGAGAALLRTLEGFAREDGLPALRLETGPDLTSACALYEREGFATRGPFGDYLDDPLSRFYEKPLGA